MGADSVVEQTGAGRRPAPGRPVPTATYRLQLRPGFGFNEAAKAVPYLHALGVSHVYLSPILEAVPGSEHGYDVIDHATLSSQAGGEAGFANLVQTLHAHGMGAIADVVPNHMAVPTPAVLSRVLWSVLRDGPASPFANWFDLDWEADEAVMLMPVLGKRIGEVLAEDGLTVGVHEGEPVIEYGDNLFPIRPGTEQLPLAELVGRQWYRLAYWRVADEEVNYRRFFDIDTLAAVRVEIPTVFNATHEVLLGLVQDGSLDGLRVDHPDGLADPVGYLNRLAQCTTGSWVVVEKILTGDETLPTDWSCSGTTGYDSLRQVDNLFLDPAGAVTLTALHSEITGELRSFPEVAEVGKREVTTGVLYAEVDRLAGLLDQICRGDVRLRDHTRRALFDVVVELLVAFDRYRAYVVPGEPLSQDSAATLERAVAAARARLEEERHPTLVVVEALLAGREVGSAGKIDEAARTEFVVRFQQTCGPVMAKGVEDTAFYRWFRLASLNEVGGEPDRIGVSPMAFHSFCHRLVRDWPTTMTTLNTHDTKRSADARAALAVLTEDPELWASAVRAWRAASASYRPASLGAELEYLVWQTLVSTWGSDGPISGSRLVGYLVKSAREGGQRTGWSWPDEKFEAELSEFARAVLCDDRLMEQVQAFVAAGAGATRCASLGALLVQLTMPGVPDTYQGCELVSRSLVDPDNRGVVDFSVARERLARLDAAGPPVDLGDEKLLVVSRVLRLRRELPEVFVGGGSTYRAVPTSSEHAVAFSRGVGGGVAAITVATRLPLGLARCGGWGGSTLSVGGGAWRDVLTDRVFEGGEVGLARLLGVLPVALLVRV